MLILEFILIAILYNQRKRKKPNYNQHIMQVEQGFFSPLIFSICDGMGRECQALQSRLSEILTEKRDIHKSVLD